MLENIKALLNIKTDAEDTKLNIYISMAITLIKNYLNNDVFDDAYIQDNFSMAIILIVTNAYECKKNGNGGNIKSITQGARSVTYGEDKAFCINEDVKAILPVPYIKLFN
jgi:hypothetical protein